MRNNFQLVLGLLMMVGPVIMNIEFLLYGYMPDLLLAKFLIIVGVFLSALLFCLGAVIFGLELIYGEVD